MPKTSFREYYEAKESLRKAGSSNLTATSEYEMTKYCKFPVVAESDDKEYLALKPKDRLSVLWEYVKEGEDIVPIVRRLEITSDDETVRVSPTWGKSKLVNWIQKNTVENK